VTSSRTVVIAGAGIGGLTSALCLARGGMRAVVLDQAERLDEAGAGIQLSPNASRVLTELGLGDRLKLSAVFPEAIRILHARDGREIVRLPLASAATRFGAPYLVMHRGDLQAALLETARTHPDIRIVLGVRLDRFAVHANGVTVKAVRMQPDANGAAGFDTEGLALIGADGLWSTVRGLLGDDQPARFARRVAWRAMIPADMAPAAAREPMINLWLGGRTHLVHYPVAGRRLINIVAIAHDDWHDQGWSTLSKPAEVMGRYPLGRWCRMARDLIGVPDRWLKWALFDRAPSSHWGEGPVTLLGDAAHPTLPFLAQGAAMAIEDANVLAAQMAGHLGDPARALRAYEAIRRPRTSRVQRAARRAGSLYHYSGPDAVARDLFMRIAGGNRLLKHYDWIYDWQPA
jgi:salicylate hydroxylase